MYLHNGVVKTLKMLGKQGSRVWEQFSVLCKSAFLTFNDNTQLKYGYLHMHSRMHTIINRGSTKTA